jgi:hypothetical protein
VLECSPGGNRDPEHTLSSTTPPPGWSLAQPFNLDDSLADLLNAAQSLNQLVRNDDGTAAHTSLVLAARETVARISGRISHSMRNP